MWCGRHSHETQKHDGTKGMAIASARGKRIRNQLISSLKHKPADTELGSDVADAHFPIQNYLHDMLFKSAKPCALDAHDDESLQVQRMELALEINRL
jgi:hypothetical protein